MHDVDTDGGGLSYLVFVEDTLRHRDRLRDRRSSARHLVELVRELRSRRPIATSASGSSAAPIRCRTTSTTTPIPRSRSLATARYRDHQSRLLRRGRSGADRAGRHRISVRSRSASEHRGSRSTDHRCDADRRVRRRPVNGAWRAEAASRTPPGRRRLTRRAAAYRSLRSARRCRSSRYSRTCRVCRTKGRRTRRNPLQPVTIQSLDRGQPPRHRSSATLDSLCWSLRWRKRRKR